MKIICQNSDFWKNSRNFENEPKQSKTKIAEKNDATWVRPPDDSW